MALHLELKARAKEFLTLLWVNIKPCEKDTTRQSIPNATAKNKISTKCKSLPQIIYSMGIYNLFYILTLICQKQHSHNVAFQR